MERKIISTSDGSFTLYVPDWDETYHSRHGAVQESLHVFIDHGLRACPSDPVRILEMGLGTGLNLLLTALDVWQTVRTVDYVALEAFPCLPEEATSMGYPEYLDGLGPGSDVLEYWMKEIHESPWGVPVSIDKRLTLTKVHSSISDWKPEATFDIVYYDAFGPRVQPELWEADVLSKCTGCLSPGGIYVTYCAKGSVRRTLEALGMEVERLPGPPGKREIIRARKP